MNVEENQRSENQEPRFESTSGAARMFKLSKSFLYKNWKRIPAARLAGRTLRWDIPELSAWMKQQAQEKSER